MKNKTLFSLSLVVILPALLSCTESSNDELQACADVVKNGFRAIPKDRADRFLGKVAEGTALCRGGEQVVKYRATPWVDWSNYWGVGDETSKKEGSEAKTLIANI